MGDGRLNGMLRHLRRLKDDDTDAHLLHGFLRRQEPAAFEALLRRHGPLVWGLCRRLLANPQDAEDAFQATFLVLIRRAAAIRKPGSVGSWLYGVAYRVATKMRARSGGAAAVEADDVPVLADPAAAAVARELRAALDDELSRLPEKYRVPLILCCLEGRSKSEAARQLGWSEGTVSSRLARARDRLRVRLACRGWTQSAGVLAALAVPDATTAAVPVTVLAATERIARLAASGELAVAEVLSARAADLAHGAVQAMTAGRFKLAAAVLVLGCLAFAGVGWAAHQLLGDDPPATADAKSPAAAAAPKVFTDCFGDPLPPGAIARMGTVRLRTGDTVGRLAFDRDSKRLASWTWDGTLAMWDPADGREIRRFAFPHARLHAWAFLPNGKSLALLQGYDDPTIHLWDFAAGKNPPPLTPPRSAFGGKSMAVIPANQRPDNETFSSFAISPDGNVLATGSTGAQSRKRQVRLWELTAGKDLTRLKKIREFGDHDEGIFWVAFSADGKTVASASRDDKQKNYTVCSWDATTGKELGRVAVTDVSAQGQNCPLAVSPEGTTVAIGFSDGTVGTWNVGRGADVRRLKGHKREVDALAFSPDGRRLVSGGRDDVARLWDVTTGQQLKACAGHKSWIQAVAFAPDGRTFASGGQDYRIRLWDAATGNEARPTEGHDYWVMAMALTPDGKTLATASWDGTIRIWEPRTGKEVRSIRLQGWWVNALAITPDGRTLAGGGDKVIHLLDVATGREHRQLVGHTGAIGFNGLTFTPDGKQLLSAAEDRSVRVWDVATGQEQRTIFGESAFAGVAVSPDGKRAAAAGGEATGNAAPGVTIWDLANGRQVRRLQGPKGRMAAVAFSSDGRYLAAGGHAANWGFTADGTSLASPEFADAVHVWDLGTGQDLLQLPGNPAAKWGYHTRAVNRVAFSPDSKTLATAEESGEVMLYELATGKPRRVLAGHRNGVRGVAYSADGTLLASVSADLTALVWDATGRLTTPARELPERALLSLWDELAGTDAVKADGAFRALTASPQTPTFVGRRLKPVTAEAVKQIPRWMADLDSDRFDVRKQAESALEKLAESAEPALRQALARRTSLEMRRRLERLLEKLQQKNVAPEHLRTLRAVEVLEHHGTPAAREVLQTLAGGVAEARLTQEAQAALKRLGQGP